MIATAKTSSIILYKFRSGTNFESVELPGTSARLFDVKRAIVKAKKLDRGAGGTAAPQLEFDLSVKNALTEEEYTDESMLLPRGTRLVIQRLPAAKGLGLLAKMARAEAGMSVSTTTASNVITNRSAFTAPTGYFTIQSRAGDEDEFVDSATAASPVEPLPQAAGGTFNDQDLEEKELAALKAVTDQAASIYRPQTTLNRSTIPNKFGSTAPAVAGGPRPNMNVSQPFHNPHKMMPPSAMSMMKFSTDPELKEHELKQMQTKKRATGIPRTFLTMSGTEGSVSSNADQGMEGDKETGMIRLQLNTIGFEALIQRGGGQSESGGVQTRSLEYALKLTATTIPEHLQCGICKGVVKNAMLVPWDTEGRAVCELCMRDNLAKNGFKCPLTGMDGVSPDDLHPNYGLRKAADLFVQGVIEVMDQIVMKQQADEEEEQKRDRDAFMFAPKDATKAMDDVDIDDSGFAKKNRAILQAKRKRQDQFDLDADFGGDVFDVSKVDSLMDDDIHSLKRVDPKSDLNWTDNGTMDNDKNGDDLFSANVETNLESDKNKSFAKDNGDSNPQNNSLMESAVLRPQKGFKTEENLIANNDSSLHTEVDPSPNSKDEKSLNRDGDNIDMSIPIYGSETTDHSSNDNKNATATASVPVIDRREFVKSRGPPPGYRIGPAGGVGVHGGFPPSSPPLMMHSAGPFQPLPALSTIQTQNYGRGDGHSFHGREGFRGRGYRGRGRDFRGGYHPYSSPPTPQEFNEYSQMSSVAELNQDVTTGSAEQTAYVRNNPEEIYDIVNHQSPDREFYGEGLFDPRGGRGISPRGGPFAPRGRGRSFDSRGGRGFSENNFGRGRGRDMPAYHEHDYWQGFGGGGGGGRGRTFDPDMGRGRDPSLGRGHDMMARGFEPRGGQGYDPRGGRYPNQMGGRGFNRGFPRGAGRGRF